MSKWHGKVGYSITEETEPGLWEETIKIREYFGDVTTNRFLRQTINEVNENINVSTIISIVADPFAYENCSNIIYVEYMGNKWRVTNIEPQRPRILLTIGGVYNEK